VENGRRGRFGLAPGIALAWLLASCPSAEALDPALDVSQYAHTAWKVREGFFKSGISSIAQTPDGFLWLGTDFGLLRFDGVRAVPWQPPPDQHLPSDSIMRLLVTRDGTLWIGTINGLASWKDGKLTQYAELDGRYIYALLEDREGALWASGFAAPIGKLCAIRKSSVQCYGDDGVLGPGVFNLYEDSKGNLWAGVKDGLWRWRPGPPKFYSLPGNVNGIQALGEDADGTLLVGWKGGIYRFVDGKTEAYSLPGFTRQFSARRMLRDRDGGLWIGTIGQGLVHIHQGRTDAFAQSDNLSGDEVGGLFQDREGTIWVRTLGGLDRFRDFAVATFTGKQGLLHDSVAFALAAKDGSIWLATPAGLNRWTGGQMASLGKQDKKLNGHIPHSLFQDSRGRIWVSTVEGGGYLEGERFTPVTGVPGGPVHGVAEDTAGSLWIANQLGGLLHLVGNRLTEQIPWTGLGHKDNASALIADPAQGGLWLGFHHGGVAYFKDGRVLAAYASSDGLGEGRVNTFRLDADGALWAATEGGLSRLKNGRIATLTSKNGLPCDGVHWSIEDDIGSVWLYMPCGLARVARSELEAWARAAGKDKGGDAKRVQATVFDSSDGVRTHGKAGGYGALVAKSSDGKLWFLPWDGVSVVDPRHLPINKLPPPIHIEQITADRKTYDASSAANGRVSLPALIRDLKIDYTALSLVTSEKVLFRYKLEGRDRDWQDAGNRREAFYTDLPPRNYRFRVVACNNSGVWNEAGTFLDLAVAPAYYQTTWFRLSCVAAFLALLGGLYQLRLRQLAREYDIRVEERVGERTRIARELHDSLLQGVQGLMFRLQAVRELLPGRAPAEAIEALDVALERGDKVIVEGRDTISDLRQSTVGDSDIAQALTALGEELAAQGNNGAAPCVRVLVEGKQREIDPVLRDEICRIAREALRNAVRHAKAQKIEAGITYSDSAFLLHVRDDGIGMAPEVANQGARAGHWGLTGMRERAKSFGGKLEVWSEQGAGTEIALTVPAAVSYGKSNARHKSWLLRKKN
jgi:signal transduction histidine kinase/ligand-binding sensor domain-containing protein